MSTVDPPRTVLVLEAKGFLGEHIVGQLVTSGHGVMAVLRPGSSHAYSSSRVRKKVPDSIQDLTS